MPSTPPPPRGARAARFSGAEVALLVGSTALITLAAFEALATTTIMPGVMADLGAQRWFSAASGAALAAQVATIVVAGPLCDARGARPVLLAGVALFAAGLGVCASAGAVVTFVGGRIVQGCGAGCLTVPLYVLIGQVASPHHRPTFFAAFSLAWVLPSIIGPGVAASMQSLWGWRSVFWLVPALALVALAPLAPLLAGSRPSAGVLPARLWRGAALGAGCGAGLIGLQLAGALRSAPRAVFGLGGAALLAWSLPKLLPRGTLRLASGVPALIATRGLAMAAQYSASAFVPLFLQRLHGWSPAAAGIGVTLGSLAWALGATVQARVHGATRGRLPLAGSAALTVGIVLVGALAFGGPTTGAGLAGWAIACLGIGVAYASLSDLALGMVDRAHQGRVAAHLQIADAVGPGAGLAAQSLLVAAGGPHAYPMAAAASALAAALSILAASRIAAGGARGASGVTGG